MKKISYIILLLSTIILSGCEKAMPVSAEKPEEIYFNVKETIEVFSSAYLGDILETNATLISENFKINTNQIGEQTLKIYYNYEKEKHLYELSINVIDTKSPIIFGGTSRTLLLNATDNFCESINYGDNYDSEPKCEITGQYDNTKVGTYKLNMAVTDSSNNTTSKNITVNIVKSIDSGGPSTPSTKRIDFADVIEKYGSSNTEFGIDVSSWQEEIDFEKVKAAGATSVMIRLGFQKSINGELKLDSYFQKNLENAKRAGLKVGIYLYTDTSNAEEAITQAEWVVHNLNGTKLELPIAFDWENWANWNKYKISFHELNVVADAFIDTIYKNGYIGALYSSKYYLESMWENSNNYPVWLAHYTETTSYQGNYFMWQLCNIGRIPGINGPVDLNVIYTDRLPK